MKNYIYAHITTITLALALVFSGFLIISDNVLPFTTQATVKTTVIDVMPEVSGYIQKIHIKEGQKIQQGDLLFSIDDLRYKIALKKTQAVLLQKRNKLNDAKLHLKRMQLLEKKALVSEETLDNAVIQEAIARAVLDSALSDLELANLNLQRTKVRAKNSGVATNLTCSKGMYVSKTTPVIHLVLDNKQWIEADFTEKALVTLKLKQEVNIVYDAIANKVFQGKIISIDRAINSGISQMSELGVIHSETRWIRPQQKIRVRIEPEELDSNIIAGSRASVMSRGTGFSIFVADIWMKILSWFRFVY